MRVFASYARNRDALHETDRMAFALCATSASAFLRYPSWRDALWVVPLCVALAVISEWAKRRRDALMNGEKGAAHAR